MFMLWSGGGIVATDLKDSPATFYILGCSRPHSTFFFFLFGASQDASFFPSLPYIHSVGLVPISQLGGHLGDASDGYGTSKTAAVSTPTATVWRGLQGVL